MPSIKFKKKYSIGACCFFLISIFYFLLAGSAGASRVDELKDQIKDRNLQIAEIEKEIEKYKQEIETTSKEAATLNTHIKRLEAEKKKLSADINLTQSKINATELNIEKLGIAIVEKEEDIEDKRFTLAKIIREINDLESAGIIEIALAEESFSDFFSNVERVDSLRNGINRNLDELKVIKADLEAEKKEKENYKKDLSGLQSKYIDQKYLVEANKSNKDKLLTETKNKEANYKKLLEEKLAKKEAFEAEMRELENELKIEIDPSSIPSTGAGVLRWPLDSVRITQYFGKTEFATKNPQIYSGGGHTGIDFGAPNGTPIKASLSGVVEGIGNTDEIKGCYSYGKWVLIRHNNGLSTLYAHLSLIKVSTGQSVATGDLVGYSGSTGYATGPHLHFTVYATQGVQITKFTNSINCKNAVIPIADKKAYLNPLSYL